MVPSPGTRVTVAGMERVLLLPWRVCGLERETELIQGPITLFIPLEKNLLWLVNVLQGSKALDTPDFLRLVTTSDRQNK